MITVLHRGGPANGYGIPRIIGYYIRNITSIDLKKNRGVQPNDYKITWRGGGLSGPQIVIT